MLVTENTVYNKQYIAMNHYLITIDSSLDATGGSKFRNFSEKKKLKEKYIKVSGQNFQIVWVDNFKLRFRRINTNLKF